MSSLPTDYSIGSMDGTKQFFKYEGTRCSIDYVVYYPEGEWEYSKADKYFIYTFDKYPTKLSFTGGSNILEVIHMCNISELTSFEKMFYGCLNLTNIRDDYKWDTSNITNMYYMFNNCRSLTELDVSNWNTSNVTDMNRMFYNCDVLTDLDVSNWNTPKVTDMAYMFYNCKKLVSLDLSGWDTSRVTDMSGMFYYSRMKSFGDISIWDTNRVTNMRSMFSNCDMDILNIAYWDVSRVTDMSYMFSYCYSLDTLNISNWNSLENLYGIEKMFYSCHDLKLLSILVDNCPQEVIDEITRLYNITKG